VTPRPEPGRPTLVWPYEVVTDDYVIEALRSLPEWRVVGDSLDWELAVYAYDVPADILAGGVIVPAGLYTREITVDGRHVLAHRWNDRAARENLLDDVENQHYMFEHIAHADHRFVAEHRREIHADADRAFAMIESDEAEGGLLYDAPIRCWDDLIQHVNLGVYVEDLARDGDTDAVRLGGEFVTAVEDRVDTLLHQRDRLLSVDEAEAAGFDGTLRDGSEPHTWASLTPRQRAAAGLTPGSTAGQIEPQDR
jgi:hypothetical protein